MILKSYEAKSDTFLPPAGRRGRLTCAKVLAWLSVRLASFARDDGLDDISPLAKFRQNHRLISAALINIYLQRCLPQPMHDRTDSLR